MNQKELTKTFMKIPNLQNHQVAMVHTKVFKRFNPLTAKLFNLNFHSLEVVSR